MKTIETIKNGDIFYGFDSDNVIKYEYKRRCNKKSHRIFKNGILSSMSEINLIQLLEADLSQKEAENLFKNELIKKHNLDIFPNHTYLTKARTIGFIDAMFLTQRSIEKHRADHYFELCHELCFKGSYYNEIEEYYKKHFLI